MTVPNLHGTVSGYVNHGCRCDACTEAKAAYMRDRYSIPCRSCGHTIWTKAANSRAARQRYGDLCRSCWLRETGQLVHGTEGGYKRGCRCDACREATNAARRRRRRHPNVAVHGKPSGYSNGCRCEECTTAHMDYRWLRGLGLR